MLTDIHIRDLATIEALDLALEGNTTMITGETGAGKSIFIEAIELALGGRASQNWVRPQKDKADISLSFDITHFPRVIECLSKLDLHDGSPTCIIRRVITSDGRSRSYVNGAPATLPFVKELGELLFHSHGQYDQQVLLKPENQRDMLDRFANHLSLATQVRLLAETYKTTALQIATLREKSQERETRAEYLRFQLDELQTINLQAGEWEALEAEHHKLSHAEELMRHIQQVMLILSDNDNHTVFSQLHDVRKTLENMQAVESKAHVWMKTLESSLISLTDLEAELKNYLESTDLDPEKLQTIELRISQIFSLARKHKISPPALIDLRQNLSKELSALDSCDEDIQKLENELRQIRDSYANLAKQLSHGRKQAASKLEKEITPIIRSLSLPHGEFKIALDAITDTELSAHGAERICFLIKTNPDQSLQPLVKVISGGELSRLSLAVHLALANRTTIPTLIFDEIDTGLSGATAEKIGKLLRKLGDSYQVFCVTHQPQVAACGHHHLLVKKDFKSNTTHTRLQLLNMEEKTREIARMLGGEKMTQKTLEHAREVLEGV